MRSCSCRAPTRRCTRPSGTAETRCDCGLQLTIRPGRRSVLRRIGAAREAPHSAGRRRSGPAAGWFVALVVWNLMVLAAAQLTIRLIMAFSVRTTLLGTAALTAAAIVVAAIYDLTSGGPTTLSARLASMPVAMVLMAFAGFA